MLSERKWAHVAPFLNHIQIGAIILFFSLPILYVHIGADPLLKEISQL